MADVKHVAVVPIRRRSWGPFGTTGSRADLT
jgi:hypothetical protein